MDGESYITGEGRVIDTATAGALSHAIPRVQRAHTSGGLLSPVRMVSTTPVGALLSRSPDFGTTDPPPQFEPLQSASGDPRQFTESCPLALEKSRSLLIRKVTNAHQSPPNPSQTLVLPHQVDTLPAQPSYSSLINRTLNDTATKEVYPQEFVIDQIVRHSCYPDGFIQYNVRWYGFPPWMNMDEPFEHLPRSLIVQYHRRTKPALPHNIYHALVG